MCAELEKSEEGRECLARKQARVDATLQRMGEKDVTMKQDITARSGASSSSASTGPARDTESRPSRKRAANFQTEDFEDNEQLDADESAASLPQAEGEPSDGRMFKGIWEHVESVMHQQRFGNRRKYGHHDSE